MKIRANDLRKVVIEVLDDYGFVNAMDRAADDIVRRCKAKSAKIPGFASVELESKEPDPGPTKWTDAEPLNRMVGKDRWDEAEAEALGLDKVGKHKDAEETWPEIECPFDKAGI